MSVINVVLRKASVTLKCVNHKSGPEKGLSYTFSFPRDLSHIVVVVFVVGRGKESSRTRRRHNKREASRTRKEKQKRKGKRKERKGNRVKQVPEGTYNSRDFKFGLFLEAAGCRIFSKMSK